VDDYFAGGLKHTMSTPKRLLTTFEIVPPTISTELCVDDMVY